MAFTMLRNAFFNLFPLLFPCHGSLELMPEAQRNGSRAWPSKGGKGLRLILVKVRGPQAFGSEPSLKAPLRLPTCTQHT